MKEHISWPSIDQFRHVVRRVKDHVRFCGLDANGEPIYNGLLPLPKITFVGTVKLHGTNAGAGYDAATQEMWFQSRSNIITSKNDNAGFATWAETESEWFKHLFAGISATYPEADQIAIFGEWAGKGIQSKVGVSSLPKTFYIFGIVLIVDGKKVYLEHDHVATFARRAGEREQIKRIWDFTAFFVTVDFYNPELSQNEFVSITEKVEEECPVAKALGVSGLGEGVVWRPIESEFNDAQFWFNVKGEKHQSSKVKTLAAVDVERHANIVAFVDSVCTESRIEQMAQSVFGIGGAVLPEKIGDMIKAVNIDILKEEKDTLEANGFTMKEVGPKIATKVKEWVFNHERA